MVYDLTIACAGFSIFCGLCMIWYGLFSIAKILNEIILCKIREDKFTDELMKLKDENKVLEYKNKELLKDLNHIYELYEVSHGMSLDATDWFSERE